MVRPSAHVAVPGSRRNGPKTRADVTRSSSVRRSKNRRSTPAKNFVSADRCSFSHHTSARRLSRGCLDGGLAFDETRRSSASRILDTRLRLKPASFASRQLQHAVLGVGQARQQLERTDRQPVRSLELRIELTCQPLVRLEQPDPGIGARGRPRRGPRLLFTCGGCLRFVPIRRASQRTRVAAGEPGRTARHCRERA